MYVGMCSVLFKKLSFQKLTISKMHDINTNYTTFNSQWRQPQTQEHKTFSDFSRTGMSTKHTEYHCLASKTLLN